MGDQERLERLVQELSDIRNRYRKSEQGLYEFDEIHELSEISYQEHFEFLEREQGHSDIRKLDQVLLDILKVDVDAWNDLRKKQSYKPTFWEVDLSGATLKTAILHGLELGLANLSGADLSGAHLDEANLRGADLHGANLSNATLHKAYLQEASLIRADLSDASLIETDLSRADLSGADLSGADLSEAILRKSILREAILTKTDLSRADLSGADLSGADLSGANLSWSNLSETNLSEANLTKSNIYATSIWNVQVKNTIQVGLIITRDDEPTITVDNLEVAQFVYLLLNNPKIREVIDTITSKVVLILGRFTPERKVILDALKDELRINNYLPILFDFEKPVSRDFTETISTLAHLARFIIADLTEPSSIPQELREIVPGLEVPVQPILEEGKKEYAMFPDLSKYPWVFPVYHYKDRASLIVSLKKEILEPADEKARELNVMKAKRLEKR